MDAALLAKRIPSLGESYLKVLALMAEGGENREIADTLGYAQGSIRNMKWKIYHDLGIGGLSSHKEKRQLATDAYQIHIAQTEIGGESVSVNEPPVATSELAGNTSAPALTDAERLAKLNGGGAEHRSSALAQQTAEISHAPVSAAGESGGYGVASVVRLHDPVNVLDVRVLTLGRSAQEEFTALLGQGYVIEELLDYQSLSAPSTSVTRVIFIKRR